MPEQEFPPSRRLAGNNRPDRDEEGSPPWAGLPPAGPARRVGRHGRPDAPAAGGYQEAAGASAGYGRRADSRDRAEEPAAVGRRRRSAPDAPAYAGGPALAGTESAERAAEADLPQRASGPREDELEPSWAKWPPGEAGGEDDLPPVRPREARDRGASRALRAAARRRRRWLVAGGGAVVLAGIVVAVVLLTGGSRTPASVTPGALITTFQPGELRQVPNACHVVPAATVQQYLPGQAKVASPLSVDGAAASACNWTIDQPPQYRLMELSLQAYAPNGLASGDGSATFAATDAYQLALQALQTPPKNAPAGSRAVVKVLSGFGSQAFTSAQVFHVGGAVTDVATVVVRYRNVVVTVTLNGLAHSNKGNYGPVSQSQLAQAAMAFARAAEASLH